MLSQIPIAKYQEPLFGPTAIDKAKLRSYRLRGNSSDSYIAWEGPTVGNASGDRTVATQTHWLQAVSGFPRSLTGLFSIACLRRLAGAAPGENLKPHTKQKANRSQ